MTRAGSEAWQRALLGPTSLAEGTLARLTDAELAQVASTTSIVRRAVLAGSSGPDCTGSGRSA